jgi:adenosylmethionine-8-amino-7-oxononanoate aminotransferase
MPIWRPFTPHHDETPPPLRIVRAQGAYLYIDDGRSLWDGTCAWWVTVHGHAHPYIAEAIARQAATLDHVLFGDLIHPPAEILAEKLSQKTGLPYVFFSDNGSTATEVAIKIAIQYFFNQGRPRKTLLALEGAYHGDTFGAMAASARDLFTRPFEPFLFEVKFLPFPSPENEARFQAALAEIEKDPDIIGFIGEPILQGVAGMRSYTPAAWDAIARAVRKAGGLVIADEVFTGFGRTGSFLATDQCQEKPDLLCLSKGVTGGFLPLGLTLAAAHVFEAFRGKDPLRTFYHGHSYTGNPIACAAAVANLELWERPETTQKLHELVQAQATLADKLRQLLPPHTVRHTGLVLAIDLPGTPGYIAEHRHHLKAYAISRGVYLRPLGSVAYILPTLASRPEELAYAAEVVLSYVQERGTVAAL